MRNDCKWTQGFFWNHGIVLKWGMVMATQLWKFINHWMIYSEWVSSLGWKLYPSKAVKTNNPTTNVPALSMEDPSCGQWCLVQLGHGIDSSLGIPQLNGSLTESQQPSSPSGALDMMQQFTKSTVCPCEVKSDKSLGSGTCAFNGGKPVAAATISGLQLRHLKCLGLTWSKVNVDSVVTFSKM